MSAAASAQQTTTDHPTVRARAGHARRDRRTAGATAAHVPRGAVARSLSSERARKAMRFDAAPSCVELRNPHPAPLLRKREGNQNQKRTRLLAQSLSLKYFSLEKISSALSIYLYTRKYARALQRERQILDGNHELVNARLPMT